MILELDESMKLCDWLIEKGLGLGEAAIVLNEIGCGDTLAIALLKVFKARKILQEKTYEKNNMPDWGNPIVT
jgi:hypothetical protein